MGYTTEFKGQLSITPALTSNQVAYIQAFNQSRRMKRDEQKAALLPDTVREAVGLPIGHDGGYYVGSAKDGNYGQRQDASIIDFNTEPGKAVGWTDREGDKERVSQGIAQPDLWCKWTVTDDGEFLEWDGNEKFYSYIDWLQYLIGHFFSVWGVVLSGEIKWQGEDMDDRGVISVVDNVVSTRRLA